MNQEVLVILRESPEVPVFLSLAGGYALGRVRIKGFGIGTTASVLLVAMALGQFGIAVPPMLKSISFALFAFCIGYQVGPQFFGALKKEGLNYLFVTVAVVLAGLLTAILLGKALHFDKGTTAGLFAGAMTQSAAIGTADGAVDRLAISMAEKQTLYNNIAVSYAITYLFGVVGVIILFRLLPGFFRIKLREEARALEVSMGGGSDLKSPELFSWCRQVSLRAYEVSRPEAAGRTVAEVEKLFPARVAVYRIRHGETLAEAAPGRVVSPGDILVMAGNSGALVPAPDILGREVDVARVLDLVGETLDVCVLNPQMVGRTLGEIGRVEASRGLFLTRITRQGHELPLLEDTVVDKCDIMRIVGAREEVERVADRMGYPERPTAVTDLMMVGLGCAAGTLIGLLVLPVAGIPLTLGTGGGVLAAGLVCGWLRSLHPTFGEISEGGQWLLNDLGLSLFVACVGLASGKAALTALQTSGLSIFLAGVVLALLPIVIGLVFGKYVLKMNPVLLLGALTGARVIPQAMSALEEDAESTTPALGFAAPFAFGNVFLTIMGSVIVNLM
jgi:putative transport protein